MAHLLKNDCDFMKWWILLLHIMLFISPFFPYKRNRSRLVRASNSRRPCRILLNPFQSIVVHAGVHPNRICNDLIQTVDSPRYIYVYCILV